jgi:hypothetical protein
VWYNERQRESEVSQVRMQGLKQSLATVVRLDDLDDQLDQRGRREEFTTPLSFGTGEVAAEVFVNLAERVPFGFNGLHRLVYRAADVTLSLASPSGYDIIAGESLFAFPPVPCQSSSIAMKTRSHQIAFALAASMLFVSAAAAVEYLSGMEWKTPPIVTPGATDRDPPSDAIVLFDGGDLSKWENGERWSVEDGNMVAGRGKLVTKESFGDCQLHIEWSAPKPAKGRGQGRGNSGIFFMDQYEIQILDSYDNETYHDGQAGAIYKQTPPAVNAMRPPGEWNAYDIFWTAPRFEGDKLISPAYITAMHNGVLILNHFALQGDTPYDRPPAYKSHAPTGPISLQDHGNPVRFRNIWVRHFEPASGQQVRQPFLKVGDQELPIQK